MAASKPDVVLVNGVEERHPEGAYYLEWREGTKRVRVSVGKDAQDSAAQRLRKEAELNAKNHGVAVALTPSNNGHRLLSVAITEWLAEIKLTKKPKTQYRVSTFTSPSFPRAECVEHISQRKQRQA